MSLCIFEVPSPLVQGSASRTLRGAVIHKGYESHSRLLGSVLCSISPVTAVGQWTTKQAGPAVCGVRETPGLFA